MKSRILIITLLMTLLICCNSIKKNQEIAKVVADSLIVHIDKYCETKVEIEGVIIHVCGVNGRKMKLKTESGAIIKIVPQDSLDNFDNSFYKKRIKVQGLVKESRIEKPYIDKMEKERTLLCHIDNTPCKDSAWVNRQKSAGVADSLSNRDILKLKRKMEQTQKNYVSVITIIAEKCEIIEEKLNNQPITDAKIHWGRRLDKFYFSILAIILTWDRDAASNSPTVFSSKRYRQL